MTPKNMGFDEWEIIWDISISTPTSSPILTPNLFQEVAMPDGKASKLRIKIERKKHLQVVTMLKEFVYTTTCTKSILYLRLNLAIGKFLIWVPTVKKHPTRAITKGKAI